MPTPSPLLPQECTLLAALLARAVANEQLALHHQSLDAKGHETNDGLSATNRAWQVTAAPIEYEDSTPSVPGVHLYVAEADIDYLAEMDD